MIKKTQNLVIIRALIKGFEGSKEIGTIESPMREVNRHQRVLKGTLTRKREEGHQEILAHQPIDTDEDQRMLIEPGNILEIKMMIEIIDIETDRDSGNTEGIVIERGIHQSPESVTTKA